VIVGFAVIAGRIKAAIWRLVPELLSATCEGDPTMTKSIIVAHATRTGSTPEVADRLACQLCAAGLTAEARLVGEVTGLDNYSALFWAARCAMARGCPR
jgi:hypothetical protein